ncbi:MAG: hypothetical protein ACC645_23630, partial [Pirellulales bacterium]
MTRTLLKCMHLSTALLVAWAAAGAAEFTPLVALPAPKIIDSAAAFPGGKFNVENMINGVADPKRGSEYATDSQGTGTFIDFDFGKPAVIAAFKHVDRFDIANVDAAELIFSAEADFRKVTATVTVDHVGTHGGTTLVAFPPVTARYVRWRVTALATHDGVTHQTVGGSEIGFFTAAETESAPMQTTLKTEVLPALVKQNEKLSQPYRIAIRYPYARPAEAILKMPGGEEKRVKLKLGSQTVEGFAPVVKVETSAEVTLRLAGQTIAQTGLVLKPIRPWTIYFLPHSHVDIGYTHVQTEVMRRQWKHFGQAIELSRRTADYPPGARFKWNTEGLWAVDSYLKEAPAQQQQEFLDAVHRGWIGLDGFYGNELTALCRPEELLRLTDCARRLARKYDLRIDSAMISDVPGTTWGLVPAMAQSGIRYLSMGPNPWHRIGRTLETWGDRPYYWVSPSGKQRVLCWMAGKSYAWFHAGLLGKIKSVKAETFFEYLQQLEAADYPYDMVQLRYTMAGDNGPPDPDLPEFVKQWNAKYVYPKLLIATTGEMFREFEHRYGEKIPEVRGDFTPYWEDGAGSSARETGVNRAAAERLVQAEALWAMLNPKKYPDDRFYAAWRNVILYDEHTWGAHCSISRPDDPFTRAQWKIKQAFALNAEKQSRALLGAGQGLVEHQPRHVPAVQVFNTSSWPRTDLIVLPQGCARAGDRVTGPDDQPVPSQRLSDGRLAFLATDVPPLGASRYLIGPGQGEVPHQGAAKVDGATLSNSDLRLTLDE